MRLAHNLIYHELAQLSIPLYHTHELLGSLVRNLIEHRFECKPP